VSRVFLNRYRVLRQVGQGGYGSVFLCEDLRLSGKRWAVKELDCRGERLADFEREAAVLSQLEHPRIPVIVDFFVQDGNGYLVREYLDGPTLHDWIEHRGPVSEAQALHWGIQIAEVLQYLHGRQPPLYHRDLKPQNIVILPDGLRLMDFGLAREEWQEQAGGTGSVSFTAPEQFGGRHRPGAAADIYSLGAILYYMLMGVPPGPTGGEHRLLPQRPMLQPTTETIILQCLNSDPILRPEDAADVSSILQYNAARLPSPPTPTVPRQGELEAPALTKPGTTSSWTLGKAALPLVVLLGLAGMLLFSMPQPDPSKPAPPAETGGVTFAKVQSYLAVQRYAEAEGSLKVTVAGDPGCGWARLLLAQLPLMRHHPNIPRVPLLVPLDGEEAEHVNWVLQGVALAQMEEQRFIYELVDTHGVSVLTVYKDAVERTRTNMVLGPFGSQEALLVAPWLPAHKSRSCPSAVPTRGSKTRARASTRWPFPTGGGWGRCCATRSSRRARTG
jgi:hypothetical protein